MKKLFVLFISFFLLVLPVYASTNTYSRTTTDLKVPKKIKYKYLFFHNFPLSLIFAAARYPNRYSRNSVTCFFIVSLSPDKIKQENTNSARAKKTDTTIS